MLYAKKEKRVFTLLSTYDDVRLKYYEHQHTSTVLTDEQEYTINWYNRNESIDSVLDDLEFIYVRYYQNSLKHNDILVLN